ncbi:MAG TPA: hypothetical protein VK842_08690, partial [bacterium]|nr:hypothetical protein [bacterium]
TGLTASAAPRNVYLDGLDASSAPQGGEDEVVLDIDLAQAMAPAATVVVYMGSDPDDVLAAMADDPAQPGQFSSSWFWGALSVNAGTALAQCAVQGQAFFEASGDQGAFVDGWSVFPYSQGSNDYIPLDKSITEQPDVTVVGGTRLTTAGAGGAYLSETTWYKDVVGTVEDVGSGGGVSTGEPLPLFQLGLAVPGDGASTLRRNLPDVSAAADDILTYLTLPTATQRSYGNAGTSAAAPLWAGFMALVNEQAGLQHQPPVGWANAALYATAESVSYTACFHDVADLSQDPPYRAGPGYDLCTGWGSPHGMALVRALVAPNASGVAAAGALGVGGGRLLTYPNPFHPGQGHWLHLSFPKSTAAALFSVFDAGYRRVAELPLDVGQAATGGALFNGHDDSGRDLPPGVYYAVFKADGAPLRCAFTVLP